MALMKVREYARHRGCSHVAVLNAIKSGRLAEAVSRTDKGSPIIDSETADREWPPGPKEILRPEKLRASLPDDEEGEEDEPSPDPEDHSNWASVFAKARAQRENYRAKQAKLEYEEQARKLISAEKVKTEWVQNASLVRNKILGIPSKLKQKAPDLTSDQYDALESIVRESLEELADGD